MLIELFQPQPAFAAALASYETGGPWLTATPVTGWLAAVGLIVLAITATRFLEDCGTRLVGPRSCDAAAARPRRVHFLRVVWAAACPIAQVLVPESGAEDGIRTRDLRFTKPLLYQLSYFGLTAERGEHAIHSPSRKL